MFANESPFRDVDRDPVTWRAGPKLTSIGRKGKHEGRVAASQTWHPIMRGVVVVVVVWGGQFAGNAESVCCASINPGVLPGGRSIANTKAHWWQTALDKHMAFFLSSIAIISKVTASCWTGRRGRLSRLFRVLFTHANRKLRRILSRRWKLLARR